MNKPIGIPSGWEEVVAWFYCSNQPIKRDACSYFDTTQSYDMSNVIDDEHDWREEPAQ